MKTANIENLSEPLFKKERNPHCIPFLAHKLKAVLKFVLREEHMPQSITSKINRKTTQMIAHIRSAVAQCVLNTQMITQLGQVC